MSYSDLAALAEASYVLFDQVKLELSEEVKEALIDENNDDYEGHFSDTQADEFLSHWRIVDHQPNTESGFSGTLFERIDDDPISGYQAGDLVFALRGTETGPLSIIDDLYRADYLGIVANGLAFRQIIDMYNYWQRLITPDGEWARQASLVLATSDTPADRVIDESGIRWTIAFEDAALGLGQVGTDDNIVAATGHSLGGHLATAFARLFPAWTTAAVTINGAGYPTGSTPGLSGTAEANIANLFSLLGGASAFDPAVNQNLYGAKGLELVTMNEQWGLVQPGLHLPVYIEDALGNTLGHGASQMTDALAVYDLFTGLVPGLKNASPSDTLRELQQLAEVASASADYTYESLVDQLARLFGVDTAAPDAGAREALYRRIADLRATGSPYNELAGSVHNQIEFKNLADYAAPADLAAGAQDSLALRYALKALSPFALFNVDQLYASHNQDHELDLFDPATGIGMTPEYLYDRADFLVSLLGWNAVDGAPSIWTASDPWHFADRGLGIEIDNTDRASEFPVDEARAVLFGGRSQDVLSGGGRDDALYGGPGADVLDGGAGSDYLEGGEGNDIYVVGDGDRLFDHDGMGGLLFAGELLVGGRRDDASGAYLSADGGYRYSLLGDSLLIERPADGANLSVIGFHDGDLGIWLEAPGAAASGYVPTQGTPAAEVIHGRTDVSVTDMTLVNGYNLPDHIQGGDGRDWIFAWQEGGQQPVSDQAEDVAPDTDIVEGGAARDFLHGGAGDDRLYATELADADAVRAGLGASDYGISVIDDGDFVSGQGGDDELYGSAAVDGLFGGDGDDLIYGGGGDDIIAGDWSAVLSEELRDLATYDYDWYSLGADGNRKLNLGGYVGGIGRDRIHAGEGADLVWGGAGNDLIFGEAGDDRLNGDMSGTDGFGAANIPAQYHGSDFISGGDGDDAINGNGGDDTLIGGAGDDVIDGDFRVLIGDEAVYHGDDYLDGGIGADVLSGSGGADVLLGGEGDDALFGDLEGLDAMFHGDDVLYGGAGDDQLVGHAGGDTLHGGAGDDVIYGDGLGADTLSGDDTLFGGAGDDVLSGGRGNDILAGDTGHDALDGGPGDDRLHGEQGNDSLTGGAGNDHINGGAGFDEYQFAVGHGSDIVADAGGYDLMRFADSLFADLNFAEVGEDLVVMRGADRVTIGHWRDDTIDEIRFADGQVLSIGDALSANPDLGAFLTAADIAPGSVVDGTAGNDSFHVEVDGISQRGGDGDDTYRLSSDYPATIVDDHSGETTLVVAGEPLADLYLNREGDDLIVTLDRAPVARLTGGALQPPARLVAPSGELFMGDDLLARVNTAPLPGVAISPIYVDEDTGWTWSIPGDAFRDADDVALEYSLLMDEAGPIPGWLSFDPLSGTLSGTPSNADVGSLALTAVATDRGGLTAASTFVLTVLNTNDAPHLVTAPDACFADSGYAFRLDLADKVFADVDQGDSLRFGLSSTDGIALPGWLSVDAEAGLLSGIPAETDVGERALLLTVTDRAGESISTPLRLIVQSARVKRITHSAQLASIEGFQIHSMASAGDIDGDGFEDLLVQTAVDGHSATNVLAPESLPSQSAVYLYYGQAGGWAGMPARQTLLSADAYFSEFAFSVYPNAADHGFADVTLRALGDIDGDGFDDVAIQAAENGQWVFKILHGGATGWATTAGGIPPGQVTTIRLGDTVQTYPDVSPDYWEYAPRPEVFMQPLDWNADGKPDLMFSNTRQSVGLLLDFGRWKGRSVAAAELLGQADMQLVNSGDPDGRGIVALNGVGDVNGDGFDDIFVSSHHLRQRPYWADPSILQTYDALAHRILFGGPMVSPGVDLEFVGPDHGTEIFRDGYAIDSLYNGLPVSGLGDINGDGYDDVAVGYANSRLTVLFGGPDLASGLQLDAVDGTNGFSIEGLPWTYYATDGFEITGGDVNGDGLNDILIGTFAGSDRDPGSPDTQSGMAWVVFGHSEGYSAQLDLWALQADQGFRMVAPYPDPPAAFTSGEDISVPQPYDGIEQLALADIDGDGIGDLLKAAVDGNMAAIQTLYGQPFGTTDAYWGSDQDDVLMLDVGRIVYTRGGQDQVTLHSGAEGANVDMGAGDDMVRLEAGAWSVDAAGAVRVSGGAGDDLFEVSVPSGDSVVRLPAQGVHLYGGPGADTYAVSASGIHAGRVFVDDRSTAGQSNSLVMGFGYSSSGVTLGRGSLLLSFPEDGLEIHLQNFDPADVLAGPRDIDTFRFADGTELRYADLIAQGFDLHGSDGDDDLQGTSVVDRMYGMAGDDALLGGGGDDRLEGGAGDDRLQGGAGDDTYVFGQGDGIDTLLDDSGHDRIRFAGGVHREDVLFRQQGEDLEVQYSGQDSIRVERWFSDPGYALEAFEFADGTALSRSQVEASLASAFNRIVGTQGDDQIWGGKEDDLIEADAGDDVVFASAGNDHVRGGGGADWLFGARGDDLLVGGAGLDILVGGTGSDEYRFGRGDGADRIYNWSWQDGDDVDTLRFSDDVRPDQLWFSRSGVDLTAQIIGGGERVSVTGWYYQDTARLERVVAGGGDWIGAEQLERLIAAVAGFNVPDGAVVGLSPTQQEDYSAIVAGYWSSAAEPQAQMTG